GQGRDRTSFWRPWNLPPTPWNCSQHDIFQEPFGKDNRITPWAFLKEGPSMWQGSAIGIGPRMSLKLGWGSGVVPSSHTFVAAPPVRIVPFVIALNVVIVVIPDAFVPRPGQVLCAVPGR